jgi:hypothetical protein
MQITDKILLNPGTSWNELFEKVDFFGMYKTYVQVVASASSAEGIKDWSVALLPVLDFRADDRSSCLIIHYSYSLFDVFICFACIHVFSSDVVSTNMIKPAPRHFHAIEPYRLNASTWIQRQLSTQFAEIYPFPSQSPLSSPPRHPFPSCISVSSTCQLSHMITHHPTGQEPSNPDCEPSCKTSKTPKTS